MDSAFELPAAVAVSVGSGLFTIGVVWGMLKSQLSKLADSLKANNEEIARHAQDLRIREVKETATDYRLRALEESKSQSVPREVFEERMNAQDRGIDHIAQSLKTKASVPTMRRQTDQREEPSEPPMPPPRPRLPSTRF